MRVIVTAGRLKCKLIGVLVHNLNRAEQLWSAASLVALCCDCMLQLCCFCFQSYSFSTSWGTATWSCITPCHWAAKWLLKLRQWLSSATGYLKHSQDATLQDFLFSFCGYSRFVYSTTATWFKLMQIQRNCIDMPWVPECHRSCWGHLSKENRLWRARTEWVTLVYPLVCWAWGRHNFASGGALVK